jgi:lipoyl(octanoyl) transferase
MRSIRTLRATGVDYHVALDWQHATAEDLRAGTGEEALALIQHTPVYTMGARGGRATVLAPLEALPAPLVDTDRGGDITWHGPGQLVAYPILDLRARAIRPVDYIRRLEVVLIDTLAAFGIEGVTMPGRPGVWVGDAKIAAIGVRIRGGVSTHGIALNVAPDLAWYDPIVPCSIAGAGVTSIARELGASLAMGASIEAFSNAFVHHFNAVLTASDPSPLTNEVGERLGMRAR